MHCGTTVDTFLRENLDWLARATNWAKFSATAGVSSTQTGCGRGVWGSGWRSVQLPGRSAQAARAQRVGEGVAR